MTAADITADAAHPGKPRSEWSRRIARFRRNKLGVLGLFIVIVACLVAVFSPWLAPYHYATLHPGDEFLPTGSPGHLDRKSTRLNSSHVAISYAVVCLKKKNMPPGGTAG